MGKFPVAITAAILLFLFAGDRALAQERVTARQLVQTVDSALGDLAKAASEPRGGFDPKNPKTAPFWSTLNGLRIRVLVIESALARRDGEEFFTVLDQGSTDLGALRVAWARAGVNNPQAVRNLRIASSSYRTLRANYGREGMRLRRGGDLSEAEQRQLQRLQRAQRRFAESLRALREQARRQDDRVTVAELDRFRGEAERIALAPANLESYLNSLIASSEVRGEWEANTPYLKQEAPEDFVVANEMVEDLYVESDIGHVFTADLGAADGDSDFLDQEVAVQADAQVEAEAVQIYELGDEDVADEDVADEEIPLAESAPVVVPAEDVPAAAAPVEEEIVEEDLPEDAKAGEVKAEDIEEVDIEDVQVVEPEAPPADTEKTEKKDEAKPDSTQKAPAPAEPAKPAVPPAKPHPKKPPIG
jgi:hypothetical protein